jgi:hypothetical protein
VEALTQKTPLDVHRIDPQMSPSLTHTFRQCFSSREVSREHRDPVSDQRLGHGVFFNVGDGVPERCIAGQ